MLTEAVQTVELLTGRQLATCSLLRPLWSLVVLPVVDKRFEVFLSPFQLTMPLK